MKIGIITSSDSGYEGKREDISGKIIQEICENRGHEIVKYILLPDEISMLKEEMISMADDLNVDLILTTGGTGFSVRDNMPEATKEVIKREVPGIAEAMRYESLKITRRAMLSRAVSGIRDLTLIVNLPGSPKAVKEMLDISFETIEHGVDILNGSASNCARK